VGTVALLTAVWKTWPKVSSANNPFSAFLSLIWTESLGFSPTVEFKLVYLFILGDAMLISGIAVYILSVQRVYVAGKVVWYRCPFCNKDWRSSGVKALVLCPHCRQLVHPKLIEKPNSL
jgi:DNA-directed RNA polymerase subunit RPC12/RpoP